MSDKLRLLTIFLLSSFLYNISLNAGFKRIENTKSDISQVIVSAFDDDVIYFSSGSAIFKANIKDNNIRDVFTVRGQKINFFIEDKLIFDRGYVASQNSVYQWYGKMLKKIFSCGDDEVVLYVGVNRGEVFVGTTNGLYWAADDFWKWYRVKGIPFNTSVYYIDFSSDKDSNTFNYVLTSKGVYISKDMRRFNKVFSLREDEEEKEEFMRLNYIKRDIKNPKTVYLATSKGIFYSNNKGLSWRRIFLNRLRGFNITCLAQTKLEDNVLYLATNKGVFRVDFSRGTIKNIFEGLPTSDVRWIDFNSKGKMFVGTPQGVYINDMFNLDVSGNIYSGEVFSAKIFPSIREVQKAALDYNEVSPEKIRKWRKSLKVRGLFPKITVDYDRTINYDSGSDRYYVGPSDWGVSLSWNIADFIWSPYEDDVDTRSRLNTQLRLDILDEVNRVYFELRRQVKNLNTQEEEGKELEERLRIEELIAILDGYTGGYFSRRMKELNR